MALHRGLAREVDPALAVDLGDHHHDLVADRDDVLDGRHVVVGELADPDQAFLARQDLDEGAEAHDPGDLAKVERADLDFAGQALDPRGSPCASCRRDRRDLDRAVVLDVDLGPVSSWILRIIVPPLPMMSRIFSGLILIVMIRGAKSLIVVAGAGMTSIILSRMDSRATRACSRPSG